MSKTAPKPVPRLVFPKKSRQPIDVLRLVRWRQDETTCRLLLVAARRDGQVQVLDLESGKQRFELSLSLSGSGSRPPLEPEQIVSVDHWQGSHTDPLVLVVCTNLGRAQVTTVRPSGELKTSIFNVAGPIDVMRVHSGDVAGAGGPCIAFGGKENDLQIWRSREVEASDLAWFMLDPHWQAKNVKDDELGLRVPVWISDLQFMPSPSTATQAEGYRIATCTRYNHVRLYDTSKSRRPIVSVEIGQYPLTKLLTFRWWPSLHAICNTETATPAEQATERDSVVVTDTHGNVYSYNLASRKLNGAYKGFNCAVSDIAFDGAQDQPGDARGSHLCVAGVDGFVRTYDAHTRKQVSCLYTGKKITHLCADTALASLEPDDERDADRGVKTEDEDDGDIWEGLDEVDEARADGRRSKRARRS